MGNCKSWMNKQREPSKKLTLAILGLDNAGKTVTTKGLQGETLDTVAPTIGFSTVDFKFEKMDITLFDLGGGKRIRDIWKNYFCEIYGLIYVVDSSDAERMQECKGVLCNLLEHPKIAGKPVLLLANKQDVSGALDEIDICEHLDLEETVNMNKCPCRVETCSAIMGQGKKLDKSIQEGFSWLLNVINSNWDKISERVEKDVRELKEKEAQDKKERAERVRKQREERERKKKEERELRGEKDSDDEDETPIDGTDPFKKLSLADIKKKEQQQKEENKKKKSLRRIQNSDDESEEEGRHKSSCKKNFDPEKDSDEEVLVQKSNSLSTRALPPIERSPQVSRRTYGSLDSDEDSDTGEISSSRSLPQWTKSTTPRPLDGSSPLDPVAPRFVGSRSYDDGSLGVGGRSGRRALAPLAPLTPLAPLDAQDTDKKKKKKKIKRNQTGPTPDDFDTQGHDNPSYKASPILNGLDLPEAPRSWGSSSPGGGRSMMRASRSPRLETLQEPENGEEVYSSSFSNKYGLEDGLPELAPEVSSRRLPNTDYDSIIT